MAHMFGLAKTMTASVEIGLNDMCMNYCGGSRDDGSRTSFRHAKAVSNHFTALLQQCFKQTVQSATATAPSVDSSQYQRQAEVAQFLCIIQFNSSRYALRAHPTLRLLRRPPRPLNLPTDQAFDASAQSPP
jgi:hypothetical protein